MAIRCHRCRDQTRHAIESLAADLIDQDLAQIYEEPPVTVMTDEITALVGEARNLSSVTAIRPQFAHNMSNWSAHGTLPSRNQIINTADIQEPLQQCRASLNAVGLANCRWQTAGSRQTRDLWCAPGDLDIRQESTRHSDVWRNRRLWA